MVAYQSSFPIKRAILGVTAVFSLFLFLIFIDALDEAEEEYQQESQQILSTMSDLTHTLRSVEFEMTTHSYLREEQHSFPIVKKIENQTCYFISDIESGPGFDFVYSGPKSMCDEYSHLNLGAMNKLSSANVMAYLVTLIDKVSAFYFISKDKYIISSPSDLANNMGGHQFDDIIEGRPFWANTVKHGLAENRADITFTGEYEDLLTHQPVITLTVGVYNKGHFIGVLGVDAFAEKIKNKYGRDYVISDWQGFNNMSLFSYAISRPLSNASFDSRLYLTVSQTWQQHMRHLWISKYYLLVTLCMVYLFIVIMLLKKNWSVIDAYEHYLGFTQSDSGLLNLLGLEDSLKRLEEEPYLSVALYRNQQFDHYISTYGKEVYQQLYQHVIDTFSQRIREKDLFVQLDNGDLLLVVPTESEHLATHMFASVEKELSLMSCRLEQGGRIQMLIAGEHHCFPVHHYDNFHHLWTVEQAQVLFPSQRIEQYRIR